MLKLGYTLPNLANRFLHSSTEAAFSPFCEMDKEYNNYNSEMVDWGPSIIFTRYSKVGDTRIRESGNNCKSTGGIDASQLYCYWCCTATEATEATLNSRLWTTSNRFIPTVKMKPSLDKREKKDRMGFNICNTAFEAMGCFFHFCFCQGKIVSLQKFWKRIEAKRTWQE